MSDTKFERRTDGKHSPYFELRDALASGGCAVCRVAQRAAFHYLDTLNYEGVNDPGLRQGLLEANGLCFRHAWEWTRMRGSALGVAIVYRNIIKDIHEALSDQGPAREAGRSGEIRLAEQLQGRASCPACTREQAAATAAADLLLQHLDDPEIRRLGDAASALCLLHFRLILSKARAGQAIHLIEQQSTAFEKLLGELDEFIRKNDYRFANEPLGEERDSWTRAVAAMIGEPTPD
jgi:hypothetical protein